MGVFQPTRSKGCRLEPYGITNHVPCISAELVLHPDKAKLVHQCLASIHACRTKKTMGDLTLGYVEAIPKALNKRGPVPWCSIVSSQQNRFIQRYVEERAATPSNVEVSAVPAVPTLCVCLE